MFNDKLSTQMDSLPTRPQSLMKTRLLNSTLMALLLSLGLAACSSTTEDSTANSSPNKIYSDAKSELADGAFDKAIALMEKLGLILPSNASNKSRQRLRRIFSSYT